MESLDHKEWNDNLFEIVQASKQKLQLLFQFHAYAHEIFVKSMKTLN